MATPPIGVSTATVGDYQTLFSLLHGGHVFWDTRLKETLRYLDGSFWLGTKKVSEAWLVNGFDNRRWAFAGKKTKLAMTADAMAALHRARHADPGPGDAPGHPIPPISSTVTAASSQPMTAASSTPRLNVNRRQASEAR